MNSPIELLAPAKNADVAISAITHGADAVYIGAATHGARSAAANSTADIARACDFAHRFGARVYVTLNTLIYPSELRAVERLVKELYRVGVDALIVQDLGLLRMDLPPIALHASTQCDIRTPAKAHFMEQLGFTRLVLPREMTLEEIRAVRAQVTCELEAFVHGALCVSYSGQCYASLLCGGRSANRGECAQICRLPFTLTDGRGRVLESNRHLLSLRDLNRLNELPEMLDAGVCSLKIEGRLKDEAYVKNVVSAYDRQLRRLGASRLSQGNVERQFTPDPSRSFNRGFTTHFLFDPRACGVAAIDSPKSLGTEIGKVSRIRGREVELCAPARLTNGDGVNFTNSQGIAVGFRVNRFQPPRTIICAGNAPGELRPGMMLRRNADKHFADLLAAATSAQRTIALHLRLRRAAGQLVLEEPSTRVSAGIDFAPGEAAKSPQTEPRRRVIAKLGDTPFALAELDDQLNAEFVPASVLTTLRRQFVDAKVASMNCGMERPLRLPEQPDALWPEGNTLAAEANIANPLAQQVMRDHGISGAIQPAPEQGGTPSAAMTMRYCLRRELGRCLLTPAGREWPEPLTLTGAPRAFRLHFNCALCQMSLIPQ